MRAMYVYHQETKICMTLVGEHIGQTDERADDDGWVEMVSRRAVMHRRLRHLKMNK